MVAVRKLAGAFYAGILGLGVLSGCALSGPHRVVVVALPELPDAWTMVWGQAQYRICTHEAELGTGIPGERLTLSLPAGSVTPLLAYPFWDAGAPADERYPAGALWPPVTEHDAPLALTFRDGPVASFVAIALRGGAGVAHLNLARLTAELHERSPDDPWAVDWQRVAEAVLAGRMRADLLEPARRRSYPVPFPPGTWLSANPFEGPRTGSPQELSEGYHRYYDSAGKRIAFAVGPVTTSLQRLPACPAPQ